MHPAPGSRHLQVHAALATVALLFSLNYIISKLGLHAFSPMTFAYLRVLGSALILNLLFRQRDLPPLSRSDRWRVVAYSVLGVVINQILFLSGLALTSAHVSAILMTLIPVFTLAAAIMAGRERPTLQKIAGIGLAMTGALAVVGREGFSGAEKSLVGDLLLIGNAFAYALYLVLSKRDMARLSPRRVIMQMFAIGAVLLLPLSAWSMWKEPWSTIPSRAWIALVIVIVGPTVAAYLLNAWALAHTDSSLVASYTYAQPVLTTILAAIFLGETIHPTAIVAAAMIFAGVYLAGRPAPPAARPEAVPGSPD
ncbi:MAG TPA: DMT family transporter [Thermoanaerobaculia bacterium]|nr:DMT family transporter [Thermoanaerobaculia bacterium]